MERVKKFAEFICEMKDTRELVRDLARRLSFDKDVIKYLNTSRAKREIGWRELLGDKLHGKNLNYINYITKSMVADYNPQIVGPQKYSEKAEGDFDARNEEEAQKEKEWNNSSLGDRIENIKDRVEDIEDLLGINPDDSDSLDKVDKALKDAGYDAPEIEIDDEEEEE